MPPWHSSEREKWAAQVLGCAQALQPLVPCDAAGPRSCWAEPEALVRPRAGMASLVVAMQLLGCPAAWQPGGAAHMLERTCMAEEREKTQQIESLDLLE